jgi:holo-[acyl-carrier protein] synthase
MPRSKSKTVLPYPLLQGLEAPAGRPLAFALGNDLVALSVFRLSCTPQFIRRVFTPLELEYCARFDDPVLRYASTWAAKEAVYKALKQLDGNLRLWWRDIEICRDKPAGKPTVLFHRLPRPAVCRLTLTHDGDLVWALAVVQWEDVSSVT